MPDHSQTLAILAVPQPKRIVAVVVQGGLAAFLLWVAADTLGGASFWTPVLLALMGAVAAWQATQVFVSTGRWLVLTKDGLYDSAGEELARFDNIAAVERGLFAMKPSNGFLLKLHKPMPRAWRPGLWWRFGRRVGIGGVTSGRAAREMADIIALTLEGHGDLVLRHHRGE